CGSHQGLVRDDPFREAEVEFDLNFAIRLFVNLGHLAIVVFVDLQAPKLRKFIGIFNAKTSKNRFETREVTTHSELGHLLPIRVERRINHKTGIVEFGNVVNVESIEKFLAIDLTTDKGHERHLLRAELSLFEWDVLNKGL